MASVKLLLICFVLTGIMGFGDAIFWRRTTPVPIVPIVRPHHHQHNHHHRPPVGPVSQAVHGHLHPGGTIHHHIHGRPRPPLVAAHQTGHQARHLFQGNGRAHGHILHTAPKPIVFHG